MVVPLTKKVIAEIERVRVTSRRSLFFRVIYVVFMLGFTAYSILSGQYDRYIYTIVNMLLASSILWVWADLRDKHVQKIIKIVLDGPI